MANVRAASSEALKTYNAHVNAGTLESAKTFYIPVFNNMPDATCTMDTFTSDISKANNWIHDGVGW